MNLQRINKMKFGVIDETFMNTIVDATNEYLTVRPSIDETISWVENQKKFTSKPFLAQITGNTSLTEIEFERYSGATETIPVAWAYSWIAVVAEEQSSTAPTFDIKGGDDATLQITNQIIKDSWNVAGDNIWTYTGYAFNLAELANKLTYSEGGIVNGVKITSQAYPSTFTPRGIASKNFVYLSMVTRADGLPYFVFDRLGTHDGDTCS